MIEFSTDSKNNKILPIISKDELNDFIALHSACFFDVRRYLNPGVYNDFEIMASVDYSDILNNENLKRMTGRLIENNQQYDDRDLAYLILRHIMQYTWKLDIPFLLHLKQCYQASIKWGGLLRLKAAEQSILRGLPYWLRNEQIALFYDIDSELEDILNKIEFLMIKSNMVFPKYSSLSNSQNTFYFIHVDSGIYSFLLDWAKILLSGYRSDIFNATNNVVYATEPVKTGATLMFVITEIIRGSTSSFSLPEPALTFSQNDCNISKEIVSFQISFLIRHECGHIYVAEKSLEFSDQEEELYADEFALKYLEKDKTRISTLGSKTDSVNDIQSSNDTDRKIENIELLFLFYEMYFYASELLGYNTEEDNSHPESIVRRESLRKYYSKDKQTPLLDYAENMVSRIKEEMKQICKKYVAK